MTIKLAVGKTYINRLGDKVVIISEDYPGVFPFNCENYSYTSDGKLYNESHNHDKDLIEEYIEPA